MRFASRVERWLPARDAASEIQEAALRHRAAGEDVILLTAEEPDLPVAGPIIAAARASLELGHRGCPEPMGQLELREAIAGYHEGQGGYRREPDGVVVLPGARAALYAACQCLLDAGDAVLAPEPLYPTYPGAVQAAGATLVRVPMQPDRGFALDPERLGAALTPRARAVLLSLPGNPSGAVAGPAELDALAELCRRHDLWLICDEVLAALRHEGEHVSPSALPGMAERTVVVGSLSKSHAMTGWRVGWLLAPPSLARHVAALAQTMVQGPPGFVQEAATLALSEQREVETVQTRLRRRRDAVCRRLAGLPGLACHRPAGGASVLLDVRRTGLDGTEFARRLLASEGVAVLPGAVFGEITTGHVRLSLAVPDELLAEACNRVGRFTFRLTARLPSPGAGATARSA